MRVHVLQLIVGDKLISDSYNAVGLHLLSSGTVLDAGDISMLNRHSVDYVDIAPRSTEIDRVVEEAPTRHANRLQVTSFNNATQGIKEMFEALQDGGSLRNDVVESAFNPLIESIQEEKDVVSLLLSLHSTDDYTLQHSVQVGMLSYYLAKWMNKSEKDALVIGKAGYLHDIGKCRIHPDVLNKPSKLTKAEFEEVQKHTIHGYDIIRKSLKDETLALVALQHHERMDGSGYPLRKVGMDIHSYSRIVAVADIYSAMISSRVYQQRRDMLYVLKELHRMSFGELDPKITQVFIRNMIPNFIGKKVSLSDGREGIIIMTNPTDFFRPLININNQFLDLSQLANVEITKIAI
ncbi:HD family phosphohydrolase [Paenibacillus sp. Soil766]|uniref:HD-GYP domain-containing protein n=1 Tax=Paenibacillus sp. Soil766 TaxID=1736404 RepID=UPI00070C5404|nr:HD-GYP domain-containing protein [Paenibacillus sp. Soil766]KRF03549.1 HD family phosphohydrolase [Paenibacillus sp. Soil766]